MVECLNYNELKLLILKIISTHESIDAGSLLQELHSTQINLETHAVRMALMRYYKLGLLKRTRVAGAFRYSLSERGIARLTWLQQRAEGKTQ
jgi:DNA-binding transcriptional regulator PaaX